MNQQVEFLSEEGEDVHNVQLYLNPRSGTPLEGFYLTMRLTVQLPCRHHYGAFIAHTSRSAPVLRLGTRASEF
jgi:hypothetical protein